MTVDLLTVTLRELLRAAREAKNFDAQIVAVSSEAITPSLAASALPLAAADRFQLLVDPTQQTFGVFGCSERGDPQHGLFVIDRAGVIRAAYTGPLPYDDPREVIRQVRSLSVALTKKAAR